MPLALTALLSSPLLIPAAAFFRALLLFWPTMVLLGAVHSHLPWVPPLGAAATFLVVMLLSVLVPTSSTSND